MPPEVLTDCVVTPKADVFAMGVVMFQLFTDGQRCFPGWGNKGITESTLKTTPKFEEITRCWRRCQDLPPLLERMLSKDFRSRPTAKVCVEDQFFQQRCDEQVSENVVSALRGLSKHSKLQRAILTDIAAHMNLAELRELNAAFSATDADGDGVITVAEAEAALSGRVDPAELQQAVERLVGPTGKISYTTFLGELLASKAADENRVLWREFDRLDLDNDGSLEKAEVARLLESPALVQVVKRRGSGALMSLMDADGDGVICFEEFRAALSGDGEPESDSSSDGSA